MMVCPDHPEIDFTFKCEDHDAYICIKCLAECHLKCNEVNEIQHLPTFGKADMCGAVNESLSQLQDYANTSIKEAEENKETLRKSLSSVETEQQNVFDKIFKQLSTAKADIDLETKRLFMKELNSLERDLQQYKEVEQKETQYQRLLEVTERFGNATQLTVIPDLLSQKAKHLKGTIETKHHKEATCLMFDCCIDFNALTNVGKVFLLSSEQNEHSKICDKYSLTSDEILEPEKKSSETRQLSTENSSTQCKETKQTDLNPNQLEHESFSIDQTKGSMPYTGQKPKSLSLMKRNINHRGKAYTARCADDTLPCDIISIVILPNERLVCLDTNNMKLKVFEEDFSLSYAHRFLDGPKGMCHIDGTAVALIFYNVDEVRTYFVGQSLLLSKGKFQVSSRFRIKALAKSENKKTIAILLFENNNTIDNRIFVQIRDVDNGMILRSFVFEKYVCAKFDFRTDLFNRLLCKGTNEIIVSENCKLHCFDIENSSATDFNKDTGSISIQGSWFYKIREGSFLNNITYVTADEKGNIYVCGYDSNNVHKIAAHDDGENKIVIPNIKEPLSVSANSKKGYLVVGCEQDDYLHVYHID